MLKGISKLISPELLKVLMEMGHGDELVISDGNFPAAACAKNLIRADGHSVPELLDAILALYPLDNFVEKSVALMELPADNSVKAPIWEEYKKIVKKHDTNFEDFEYVEHEKFINRSKNAYAIIATGESAIYANIILRKGIVTE